MTISTIELITINQHKPEDIYAVTARFDVKNVKLLEVTAELVMDNFAFTADVTPPRNEIEREYFVRYFFSHLRHLSAAEMPADGVIRYRNYPAIKQDVIANSILIS